MSDKPKLNPPPRYDDVYFDGLAAIEANDQKHGYPAPALPDVAEGDDKSEGLKMNTFAVTDPPPLPTDEKFTFWLDDDGDYMLQSQRESGLQAHGTDAESAVYAMRQVLDMAASMPALPDVAEGMRFTDAVIAAENAKSFMIYQTNKTWQHRGTLTEFSDDERATNDWLPVAGAGEQEAQPLPAARPIPIITDVGDEQYEQTLASEYMDYLEAELSRLKQPLPASTSKRPLRNEYHGESTLEDFLIDNDNYIDELEAELSRLSSPIFKSFSHMIGEILDRIDMAPNDDPIPYIREYVDGLRKSHLPSASKEEQGGWIEIKEGCKMPEEDQPILYVVTGKDYTAPEVKKGLRGYETNVGWWWCDEDGIFSDVGNDGGFSHVTHWQPLPTPPDSRKD